MFHIFMYSDCQSVRKPRHRKQMWSDSCQMWLYISQHPLCLSKIGLNSAVDSWRTQWTDVCLSHSVLWNFGYIIALITFLNSGQIIDVMLLIISSLMFQSILPNYPLDMGTVIGSSQTYIQNSIQAKTLLLNFLSWWRLLPLSSKQN